MIVKVGCGEELTGNVVSAESLAYSASTREVVKPQVFISDRVN
jgi:hypothetical protein